MEPYPPSLPSRQYTILVEYLDLWIRLALGITAKIESQEKESGQAGRGGMAAIPKSTEES